MTHGPSVQFRLQALVERAERLRTQCPYRFVGMTPDQVATWLEGQYVPTVLGWAPGEVERLGPQLGRTVPEEYRAFLAVLRHLHGQLYGYDYNLRTPEAYLRLQRELLEYDVEAWNGAEQDPEYDRLRQSGLFLNTLGGFAAWYLPCDVPGPLHVQLWLEGQGEGSGHFQTEGLFLDDLEALMGRFEHRVRLSQELGGTLVYRRGEVPVGKHLGPALVDLPHDGWRVDLTEEQVARICATWQGLEL